MTADKTILRFGTYDCKNDELAYFAARKMAKPG